MRKNIEIKQIKPCIIFQATCPVLPDDSPEEVAKKVHALEYEHFPHVVEEVIGNK